MLNERPTKSSMLHSQKSNNYYPIIQTRQRKLKDAKAAAQIEVEKFRKELEQNFERETKEVNAYNIRTVAIWRDGRPKRVRADD